MGIYIEKFIVVNNYGTIGFGNGQRDTSFSASQSNSGATGPTIADFVNGRRSTSNSNIGTSTGSPGMENEGETDLSSGVSF